MKLKSPILFFVFCLVFTSALYAEDGARVEFFSPQGTVKTVRQVSVRFSEQMVPFGDPRTLLEPFDVDCPEKGAGRWADGKNWVCDFERDLPAGIRCEFRLKTEVKALSGKEVSGQRVFSFSTGGPSIRSSVPYEGNESIDEEQIFILTLDTEPDAGSVLQHVFFSVEGIQDRVGVRIVDGKEREQIVAARFRARRPQFPLLLIQSKQRFPSNTKVSLVWEKGVMSKTGVATDQDQVFHFQTRKAFTVEFHCERENPRAACIPVTPMTLRFSASISVNEAKKIELRGPDGKSWKPDLREGREESFLFEVSFKGPFPENTNFTVDLPAGLKDETGRPLVNANQFPLAVRTDAYPPLAKFGARFGILEQKADPVLPVTVRNLEPQVKGKVLRVNKEQGGLGRVVGKILNLPPERVDDVQAWLRRVASASRESSILSQDREASSFTLPRPMGARASEVIGIPLKKPGLYVVELESAILGASLLDPPRPMFVPTAALVTNLSVHFKWGRESSLVWVTRLDTGEPVKGASVTVKNCQEKVLWNGTTDANGILRIGIALSSDGDLPRCDYRPDGRDYSQMGALQSLWGGLFITARVADDMSFVHSSWDEGIEPWRYQLPYGSEVGATLAHTIFDRTLLRAGETVHMKHVLRRHTTGGFSMVPAARMPNLVSIEHEGSGQKYEFPLTWDANGISETTWSIPKEAKLGNYVVALLEKSDGKQKRTIRRRGPGEQASGRFRVEEFRVPLAKGTIQPPAQPLIKAKEITLDVNVQYLAGGGASLLPVRLRSEVALKTLSAFEGFESFLFGNGPVKEGMVRRGEALEDEEGEGEERGGEKKTVKLPNVDLVLDHSGSARTTLSNVPAVEIPHDVHAELEFRDPNGEIQTVSSGIPLWPSNYLVGIKPDSWAASQDNLKFHVGVVDLSGKPVPGAPVTVDLFERKTFTHRKRLVGGFYAYEHSTETKRVNRLCEGKTDSKGLFICEVRSPVSGNVILQAESVDDTGNRTVAHREVWVAGKGEWWFEVGDHDRIDLLPEKKRYEPGEKALFQVRMPFREATALITVEREGVIEAWVKKVSGKEPTIEVPVKGTYAPNVYVSVLVVRGRVAGMEPTAMVDLGRPAYKLGIAEINVGWKEHELKVTVSSDRSVYKVRQKAKAKVAVRTANGKVPPAGGEVTLAAVDEGLLELMANRSWNILAAMMGRRGYEVRTATAQMQVIGKRHFGLKALPQGGGGGRQTTRELFDTLLFWKGRLALDSNGEAWAEVPLNDSITRFRIVAVATSGAGLFGTGSTSIQSTQDLMLLSGLPPLIREGDQFRAGFTLRNTTERRMDVNISAKAQGIAVTLKPLVISLIPGEAKEIGWDIAVPQGIDLIRWELEAQERGSPENDRIRVTQKVVPAIPVSTFQATTAQIEQEVRVSVEPPRDSLPGRGSIQVGLRPKIADGLSGVVDYMKNYPYGCMEQRISVAVALRDGNLWKRWMSELPSYLDSDGLVKYFPTGLYGSPTLTSYILAIGSEAGWSVPDETREKMETALRRFVEGSLLRASPMPTADLTLRKLSAIEALSRAKKADAKLLGSISIEPNLWPTSAVIDWLNILQHVQTIPNRDERLKEAEQILRSRLNFQGTTMGFSTEKTDALWWLMLSNDVNAVRALLSLLRSAAWKEDLPRMAQGALARQVRGKWDLTTANAWGVLAMEKFSQAFESVPVTGSTRASLSTQSQVTDWKASPRGKVSEFAWPSAKADISITHQGTGKPWLSIQSLAAIPLKEPFSSGYRITKTIIPVEQKDPKQWSKGDILRVRLEMEAQADQTWVVVSDPVPAGVTLLGSGLGRDSQLLTKGEEQKGWVWPAYEERSFDAFRAYYEYVPKGGWSVEYTLRLNQSGLFQLPTTRAEALYFPEMFGEIPNKAIEVKP